jgi:hypothetical protein
MLRSAYAIEKRVMGNTANAVLISERMIEFIITPIFPTVKPQHRQLIIFSSISAAAPNSR